MEKLSSCNDGNSNAFAVLQELLAELVGFHLRPERAVDVHALCLLNPGVGKDMPVDALRKRAAELCRESCAAFQSLAPEFGFGEHHPVR